MPEIIRIGGMNNKEIEQVAIDLWLDGKIAMFHFITTLIDFQKKRGLMKVSLYSHDGCATCPLCGIPYPNAMGLEHEKWVCDEYRTGIVA